MLVRTIKAGNIFISCFFHLQNAPTQTNILYFCASAMYHDIINVKTSVKLRHIKTKKLPFAEQPFCTKPKLNS
jgi:hypothetical protein